MGFLLLNLAYSRACKNPGKLPGFKIMDYLTDISLYRYCIRS